MTKSARYIKIVEWSDEDGAFVGQCPGVIGPCCPGADEAVVYRELCEIVSEWLEQAVQDNRPLPPPNAGIGVAEKIADPLGAATGKGDVVD